MDKSNQINIKKNQWVIGNNFLFIIPIIIFLIVLFYVIIYFNYKRDEKEVLNEKYKEQKTFSTLKNNRIESWILERKLDGNIYFKNSNFSKFASLYFKKSDTAENKKIILEWMTLSWNNKDYYDIYFVDTSGNILLSCTGKAAKLSNIEKQNVLKAFYSKKMYFSDFYKTRNDKIFLNNIVPVFTNLKNNEPLCFVFFKIDPENSLYPLIKSGHFRSRTSETFIFEKSGNNDSIIYLSETKLKKNTALKFKLSLKDTVHPAIKAVLSGKEEGLFKGIDYRGCYVISYFNHINGTSWYLITKTDIDEINEPIKEKNYFLILFSGIFILLIISIIWTIFNHQKSNQLKKLLKSEIEKKEAEEKFRLFFEHSPVGKLITYADGSFIVNNSFCKMLGYTAEELKDINLEEVTYPDDILESSKAENDLLHEKCDSANYFKRYIHKNGSIVWTEINSSLLRDENGEPLFLINNINDITEKKLLEDKLYHSEKKLRAILDSTPFPVAMVDVQDDKIEYWSQSAGAIFGHTTSTSVEWYKIAYPDPDYRNKVVEQWKPFLEKARMTDKPVNTGEYEITCKDGTILICELYASFIEDNLIVTFNDITNRKKAEKEIYELNYNLENIVAQRTEQLENANRELEAFSYSVSHDLRAPLRAIDGFSKIILEDYGKSFDKEEQRLFNVIVTNVVHMNQLINDILNLSRASKAEMIFSKVNMTGLAKNTYLELVNNEQKEKINFSVSELPESLCDSSLIHQVFVNLISNAIKFTRPLEKPQIIVGGRKENDKNIYFIKDNGVGYNPEYSHKLFGVFQRLHKTEDFEGTGIGLAIVQRIIYRHEGKVWAESKVNEGATFYFSLPD